MNPAAVRHVGEFLVEVLDALGWELCDCAFRMPGDFAVNLLTLELTIASAELKDDPLYVDCYMGDRTAAALAVATGIPAAVWKHIEDDWRRWAKRNAKRDHN